MAVPVLVLQCFLFFLDCFLYPGRVRERDSVASSIVECPVKKDKYLETKSKNS